jgi:hypothetical protein
VEEGIDELVVHHRMTKRGTQTTRKVVPVPLPAKAKPGKCSQSRNGKKQQVDLEVGNGSGVPTNARQDPDIQADIFIDEQDDPLPDPEDECNHPETTVCVRPNLLNSILMRCRLSWINGSS